MSLHSDEECAGTNIYIRLIQDDDNNCQTKEKPSIEEGKSEVWGAADLGQCNDTYFHASAKKIKFKILSKNSPTNPDPFCPSIIKIEIGNSRFESTIEEKPLQGYSSEAYKTGKALYKPI